MWRKEYAIIRDGRPISLLESWDYLNIDLIINAITIYIGFSLSIIRLIGLGLT